MKMKKENFVVNFYKSLVDIGFDLRRVINLRNFPEYLKNRYQFIKKGGIVDSNFMVLSDYDAQAGHGSGHYFHQDLLVAQYIYKLNPNRHIDVGSSINGFVSHVATFRTIEAMDIRSLDEVGHENIKFLRANLMSRGDGTKSIADSISCLHAIEHFGLGRYGDPIDPDGHKHGFTNLLHMLKDGGTLYISFPIAKESSVCFNAHRVFNPMDILNWNLGESSFLIERFDYVDDDGKLHKDQILNGDLDLNFGCGIYTIKKQENK